MTLVGLHVASQQSVCPFTPSRAASNELPAETGEQPIGSLVRPLFDLLPTRRKKKAGRVGAQPPS
jgi:hypothetical protein